MAASRGQQIRRRVGEKQHVVLCTGNVLHGQWDWMRDPKIHSTTWEWDIASPADQWKHSHNFIHHTW
ncbi:MAG: fatty acid desaturase, partial [Actinomycetia bacterium]|nr:fatty acid desaturase [Actinomycetes bacterium]